MKEDIFKAVSLRYPEWADAPYISASAKGDVAKRLVTIAIDNGIPVIQDSKLANVLSVRSSGEFIPEETYSAVAVIFSFVARLEKERRL